MATQLFGVSSGDGNAGVSHMFADYYVHTDDPYRLARLAMVIQFKPEYQAKALEECSVDGEVEYTISAVIYEPLDFIPEEVGDSWCDTNGAAHIIEVFPVELHRAGAMVYDSLETAFSAADLALVGADAL